MIQLYLYHIYICWKSISVVAMLTHILGHTSKSHINFGQEPLASRQDLEISSLTSGGEWHAWSEHFNVAVLLLKHWYRQDCTSSKQISSKYSRQFVWIQVLPPWRFHFRNYKK